ncbi:gamma-glutamylcyclotransferase [Kroppenstedtia pulmonis]|uniref:Gamma-glutamylcyclotransferase n=1 Tax=Kroppenstedtia pulmonis TaxID=1380685 RepID=A0A7D3XPK3_9BACL|nr:gamma-glutamylcyclotransferase family protein [Kroppenstedtia pulmonis]QKG83542.1 gamma-glutamylcyclotransferase [Kroppenstedtia pulmonis]
MTGVKIFVYGTLRVGEKYHSFLHRAKPLAMQGWTRGRLMDTDMGYPALLHDEHRWVYGELYSVMPEELQRLDRLEGYSPDGNSLFIREKRRVWTDQGTTEAFVYMYNRSCSALREISSGDWKSKQLERQKEYLYFAYGSCMDNERFRSQGVEEHFQTLVGRGVLQGYSLRYTLALPDGGRADIVEDGRGVVEGKVYRINQSALHYLYKREGVEQGQYRPAWIRLEVEGQKMDNVLTFIVTDKHPETAPPIHYAKEILRGGKQTVSHRYYQQLRKELKERFQLELE